VAKKNIKPEPGAGRAGVLMRAGFDKVIS
jgi:hypothetical protein